MSGKGKGKMGIIVRFGNLIEGGCLSMEAWLGLGKDHDIIV